MLLLNNFFLSMLAPECVEHDAYEDNGRQKDRNRWEMCDCAAAHESCKHRDDHTVARHASPWSALPV